MIVLLSLFYDISVFFPTKICESTTKRDIKAINSEIFKCHIPVTYALHSYTWIFLVRLFNKFHCFRGLNLYEINDSYSKLHFVSRMSDIIEGSNLLEWGFAKAKNKAFYL